MGPSSKGPTTRSVGCVRWCEDRNRLLDGPADLAGLRRRTRGAGPARDRRGRARGPRPRGLLQISQAVLVDGVTLQDVVAKNAGRPDAKLGAAFGVDAIADGDDGIEVEELDKPGHRPLALYLNCCIICNRCRSFQLPFPENVTEMSGDHGFVPIEQRGHLVEAQPEALALQADIQTDGAVGGLVEDNLPTGIVFALGHVSASSRPCRGGVLRPGSTDPDGLPTPSPRETRSTPAIVTARRILAGEKRPRHPGHRSLHDRNAGGSEASLD